MFYQEDGASSGHLEFKGVGYTSDVVTPVYCDSVDVIASLVIEHGRIDFIQNYYILDENIQLRYGSVNAGRMTPVRVLPKSRNRSRSPRSRSALILISTMFRRHLAAGRHSPQ